MYYYFATPPKSEKFIGRPRETIVTTLNRDIRRLNNGLGGQIVPELITVVDLEYYVNLAFNRMYWRNLIKCIYNAAEAEKSFTVLTLMRIA